MAQAGDQHELHDGFDPAAEYPKLRAVTTVVGMPLDAAMNTLGRLFDAADIMGHEDGLVHGQTLAKELEGRPGFDAIAAAELHYYVANSWSSLRRLRRHGKASYWEWRQPEMEQELFRLRLAAHGTGFPRLHPVRQAQIHTNTANLLNTIGRSLEALDHYAAALCAQPGFGMAIANKGAALESLARSHYDHGQALMIAHRAHATLLAGLGLALEPGTHGHFAALVKSIRADIASEFLDAPEELPSFSLGRSKAEQAYRSWCLREGLFLNLLNTLGAPPIAARDTVTLPNHVTAVGEGPGLIGLFNQIKQEYTTARWLLWEGITHTRSHHADREVTLIDTLDYAAYGVSHEKVRLSFRMAYSILDKCAFLLNHYMRLQIPSNIVNLNRVWFVGGQPKKAYNPVIFDTQNRPFRGLYWLALDLYDEDAAFAQAIAPEAQELKEIRNRLEHTYLKLHEFAPSHDEHDSMRDRLAYSITSDAFQEKALHLLRLARAAIVYMVLGIHTEERARREKKPADEVIPPVFLPRVEDRFKH